MGRMVRAVHQITVALQLESRAGWGALAVVRKPWFSIGEVDAQFSVAEVSSGSMYLGIGILCVVSLRNRLHIQLVFSSKGCAKRSSSLILKIFPTQQGPYIKESRCMMVT
jgi:hypothetical protein